MARKLFLFLSSLAGVLALAAVALIFVDRESNEEVSQTATSTTQTETVVKEKAQQTSLFATMMAFNSNDGLGGKPQMQELLMTGWSALREDENAMQTFFTNIDRSLQRNGTLVKETGFSSNRDVVGAFVWNVIEAEKGTYDWSLPDATMEAAGNAGIVLSAVIQPFASWDQTGSAEIYKQTCKAIDFGYYDFNAGPVDDWDAYEDFLTAVVERYDGDGIDDMPGLTTRVEAWEVGNEYDGPCGGYLKNPDGYGELLKISYDTIKDADEDALVLNAGALEVIGHGPGPESTKQFWNDFFEAGYDRYVDIFNFHYNKERAGAEETPEDWIAHLDFFNDLLENSDGAKPLWVTEFGTYSGTPNADAPPGSNPSTDKTLPTQSEDFQASWYFRYAVIGFSKGLERIFIDLQGGGMGGIGASSLFNQEMGKQSEPRSFLATLQAMARVLEGFTSVEELADGQYLFDVDGESVYALWDGTLPESLEDETLVVVGLDGEETRMASDELTFDADSPVLVWRE